MGMAVKKVRLDKLLVETRERGSGVERTDGDSDGQVVEDFAQPCFAGGQLLFGEVVLAGGGEAACQAVAATECEQVLAAGLQPQEAALFQKISAVPLPLGMTASRLPAPAHDPVVAEDRVSIAVVGAHMRLQRRDRATDCGRRTAEATRCAREAALVDRRHKSLHRIDALIGSW